MTSTRLTTKSCFEQRQQQEEFSHTHATAVNAPKAATGHGVFERNKLGGIRAAINSTAPRLGGGRRKGGGGGGRLWPRLSILSRRPSLTGGGGQGARGFQPPQPLWQRAVEGAHNRPPSPSARDRPARAVAYTRCTDAVARRSGHADLTSCLCQTPHHRESGNRPTDRRPDQP